MKKLSKNIYFKFSVILVIALIIIILRCVEDIDQDIKPGDRFTIVKIIDGDTVELKGGDRLRLLGIDAPETDEPFSIAAQSMLSSLTLGKEARVEYDNERRDKYGRLLGFLFIEDSIFINKALIENGVATCYFFKENDLESDYFMQLLLAQRKAINKGINIWSFRREPEKHYINTQNSLRFHRPGCNSLSGLKEGTYRTFDTRENAMFEGLSPCRNCKP